jgi:hypothetical protein
MVEIGHGDTHESTLLHTPDLAPVITSPDKGRLRMPNRLVFGHSVFHLAFASVVPVVESKPRWSMGQYAKTARPSISRLTTVPKALESLELLR